MTAASRPSRPPPSPPAAAGRAAWASRASAGGAAADKAPLPLLSGDPPRGAQAERTDPSLALLQPAREAELLALRERHAELEERHAAAAAAHRRELARLRSQADAEARRARALRARCEEAEGAHGALVAQLMAAREEAASLRAEADAAEQRGAREALGAGEKAALEGAEREAALAARLDREAALREEAEARLKALLGFHERHLGGFDSWRRFRRAAELEADGVPLPEGALEEPKEARAASFPAFVDRNRHLLGRAPGSGPAAVSGGAGGRRALRGEDILRFAREQREAIQRRVREDVERAQRAVEGVLLPAAGAKALRWPASPRRAESESLQAWLAEQRRATERLRRAAAGPGEPAEPN